MQEQRAERDSLPARTFAPGPGLEKTTGDHGRTSSPGYRDSAFEKDVEDMLGRKPSWVWKVLLVAVSPTLLLCLFIFYIVGYIQGGTPTYKAWDKDLGRSVVMEYPVYGQVFIGLLLVSTISCVPLSALYTYCRRKARPAATPEPSQIALREPDAWVVPPSEHCSQE
ncbi:unnamed protein product [Boreogadus saida]